MSGDGGVIESPSFVHALLQCTCHFLVILICSCRRALMHPVPLCPVLLLLPSSPSSHPPPRRVRVRLGPSTHQLSRSALLQEIVSPQPSAHVSVTLCCCLLLPEFLLRSTLCSFCTHYAVPPSLPCSRLQELSRIDVLRSGSRSCASS